MQIVAAILAIAGIVMMTYADGFHSHSVIGITLVVASASMSALYKVRSQPQCRIHLTFFQCPPLLQCHKSLFVHAVCGQRATI